jgi:hypothetical protein
MEIPMKKLFVVVSVGNHFWGVAECPPEVNWGAFWGANPGRSFGGVFERVVALDVAKELNGDNFEPPLVGDVNFPPL